MDRVGNAAHGVALPYNYWSRDDWIGALRSLSLEPDEVISRLRLYPMPASFIFDRRLHFIARIAIGQPGALGRAVGFAGQGYSSEGPISPVNHRGSAAVPLYNQ
jgi:hypothetical protein